MIPEVHRISKPSKILDVAKFTPETLAMAVQEDGRIFAGWSTQRNIDEFSHIILEFKQDKKTSSKVIGDGWAASRPYRDESIFGEQFPYVVELTDVRIIAGEENYLDTALAYPAREIKNDPTAVTFQKAGSRIAEIDRLWAEMLTTDTSGLVELLN